MFALINSDELKGMNQLLVKILKNRYGDVFMRNKETGKIMNKFAIGIDRSKQKLYNLEESAQENISQDDPDTQRSEDLNEPVALTEQDFGTPEEPQFDIDLPPEKRQFKGAEEEAERRRSSTTNAVAPYKAGMSVYKQGKHKLTT
jgi:hypothetical protein